MGAADEGEPMQRPNGGEEKILVSVRLRPLNEKEIATNDISDWECINNNTIINRNSLSSSERSMYPASYTFDRVFSPDCSTRQVYNEGAKEVALSVISGIHSSVFAYGQTSSGKTYTMGGVTEYAVADIYEYIDRHTEREFVLKFCAIEIYNESVRDLLSTDPTPLRLLDDPERGTVVERLTEEIIRDWNHFKELLSICQAQRQVGETNLNEASSRSHQILRLTIESSLRTFRRNGKSNALAATVNFIDLAGSERASQTLSDGTRLKEGCHINRSLLTLGTVIRKLSKGRNGHIPYRDSKLTRILQSSLGGNARTAIICTMSPARMHVEQSRNTLLFASCAKEVTTNARVNVVMSDKALVKQLQRELARLENELKSKGMKTVASDVAEVLREKDNQINKLKAEVSELMRQLSHAQAQVDDLLATADDRSSTTWADADNHYPKIRVRDSERSEISGSYSSISGNTQFIYAGLRSFEASLYSGRQSTSSSDENFIQLTELDEGFLQQNSSPELPIVSADFIRNDVRDEDIEEQTKQNAENVSNKVECKEAEESVEKGYASSDLSESSPNRYPHSYASSPNIKTGASGVTEVDYDDGTKEESESFAISEQKELVHSSPDSIRSSPEKLSPLPVEEIMTSSRNSNLIKSRSCAERVMSNSPTRSYAKLERTESTPLTEFEKAFQRRAEHLRLLESENTLPRRPETLKYEPNIEKLSRNDSQTCTGGPTVDDLKVQTFERLIDWGKSTSASESDPEMISDANKIVQEQEPELELQQEPEPEPEPELESEPKLLESEKDVRDVGLDPIPDAEESSSKWPLEFKKFQSEIAELWHACNISLIHRTYFFMLFKGDPADSFYMEVELRRLSFLKDTFSRGTKTMVNGEILTLELSKRALNEERQMLSKQMQKRLTTEERENLFLRWGVSLSSSYRRMQLAHLLWSKTDLGHVTESANLVAKLLGFEQQDQPIKEMFGLLNFTPKGGRRKSSLWKFGGLSLL